MKKIYSFIVVLAAVAFVSCGGNANKNAEEQAPETVEMEQAECTGDCANCTQNGQHEACDGCEGDHKNCPEQAEQCENCPEEQAKDCGNCPQEEHCQK